MSLPKDRLYNTDSTWVIEKDGVATLGMVQESVDKAQDIVFINLPKKNDQLTIGKTYVSVESVKWSGELESPVSGEVVQVNDVLFDQPELLNQDSYINWIVKVRVEKKDTLYEANDVQNKYTK
ncbi:MAG: glycine cleavage system protein H [Candidatus Woesearchaeota archaeon]